MPGPQATLDLNGHAVLLLGTVPGFGPDAERVAAAVAAHRPTAVALGVPEEDVVALQALAADPTLAEGLEPDELDAHFLALAARWGATKALPSPDLAAAHASGLPLVGIDLDDSAHTAVYTQHVKLRHLVQRSSVRRRLAKDDGTGAADVYALARAWDDALCGITPFAALEAAREEAMADGVRALAKDHPRLLVVLHAARLDGVLRRLHGAPSAE